jgi:hypothetical protein
MNYDYSLATQLNQIDQEKEKSMIEGMTQGNRTNGTSR